ncbi:hypothetical protein PPL_03877 [Heterostelium album PN500]|uniref:Uncharacterized protein n=1 Tax=Heterostelium pallidum (strain ATCC 26659 / Pp 5 / PN500) TaxID=670386 RepID=D3B5D9_HETP5|nr:hypothetical protein PPL_03877 [Heterostelium album PN500]EFA83087.1 hypothetical protein PPL_03877 [Heterostelium album PN500]|eukprot:XP_020435204.1 hypothetical protein PPL_03877 [Heterostelium album PN500]
MSQYIKAVIFLKDIVTEFNRYHDGIPFTLYENKEHPHADTGMYRISLSKDRTFFSQAFPREDFPCTEIHINIGRGSQKLFKNLVAHYFTGDQDERTLKEILRRVRHSAIDQGYEAYVKLETCVVKRVTGSRPQGLGNFATGRSSPTGYSELHLYLR